MLTRLVGLAVGLAAASAMIIGAGILTSGHSNAANSPPTPSSTRHAPDRDSDGPGHMRFWGNTGPGTFGRVTKVAGNTITVQTPDGQTVTVTVSGSTQYHGEGTSASLSSITPGTTIAVMGTRNGNTIQAGMVAIIPLHAAGTVTNVEGNTITISPRAGRLDGTNVTKIVTSSSTSFRTPGTGTASLSSVKTGDLVIAEGMLSADGTTLQATRVILAAPGSIGPFGGRFFEHGRFGPGTWDGPGGWGKSPQFVSGSNV